MGDAGGATPQWVDEEGALAAIVADASKAPAYAIDTEFHRERTYYPRLALVQLAWPGGLALVDPLAVDVIALSSLLDGEGLAVAHAAEQDFEVLQRHCGTVPSRLFDTQLAAGFLGLSSPSLSSLVERVLGLRLAKGDRLTDWTQRPLSAAQRDYAVSDVVHLLDLHAAMVGQLSELGRLGWAEQECELLRARRRGAPRDDEAWWKLRECRQLRGRSRAVAQELAAWRERAAATSDRPARFVLPDLALVAMAHRPPKSREELRQVRGLEGRSPSADMAAGILAAVEAGLSLPEDQLRTPPREELDRSLRPAASLAAAWVSQRAGELKIDTALLGTRADIYAFLRGDEDARLAEGWRRELLGEDLGELVGGRAGLAIGDEGGLVIEERSHRPLIRSEPRADSARTLLR